MPFNRPLAALGCAVTVVALVLTGCSSKGGSTASPYYPTTDVSNGKPVAEDPFKKCEDHDNYVVTVKEDQGKKVKRCFQPPYNLNLPRVTDSTIVLSYPECDTDEYLAVVPVLPIPVLKKEYFCFDYVPGSDKGKKPKHRRSASPSWKPSAPAAPKTVNPSKSSSTPKTLAPQKDDTSEKDASKKDTSKSGEK